MKSFFLFTRPNWSFLAFYLWWDWTFMHFCFYITGSFLRFMLIEHEHSSRVAVWSQSWSTWSIFCLIHDLIHCVSIRIRQLNTQLHSRQHTFRDAWWKEEDNDKRIRKHRNPLAFSILHLQHPRETLRTTVATDKQQFRVDILQECHTKTHR